MPYISIKSEGLKENLDLRDLNKRIAEKMETDRKRIIISWETFHEGMFYRHYDEYHRRNRPVVIIRLSKRNTKEFYLKLVDVIKEELCSILKIEDEDILLFIHQIEEGFTYINGQFI
ncbi:MAG: hypothetical protein ACOWWH_04770 [Eubacteriaceae bacterium]